MTSRNNNAARLDSDGEYGRVVAINLETRKVVWVYRRRAPISAGTLATADGVVFAGSIDRVFAAYDAVTGKELWRISTLSGSGAS